MFREHIAQCLRALSVLWHEKTIGWMDRLRLWIKTISLYACFVAFTDRNMRRLQLHGAMSCAILSAIYDYETDWEPVDRVENSIYARFLYQYVPVCQERGIAMRLFQQDLAHELSSDGLERGADALTFYRGVIGSRKLRKHFPREIEWFGRELQIVDDALDYEKDRRLGHMNCFLAPGPRRTVFLKRLRFFLESAFFRDLVEDSPVFWFIRMRCSKFLNRAEGKRPRLRDLLQTCRLHTGVYAFFLTLAGYTLAGLSWTLPAILNAEALCFATWSIMVFNDLMDRERDAKKGKTLANEFLADVFGLWKGLGWITLISLVLLSTMSWQAALFSGIIWVAGLAYSLARLRFPLNNALVAVCSAAPIFVGSVQVGVFLGEVFLVAWIIFWAILANEIRKDTRDVESDRGAKDTLALKTSPATAIIAAMVLVLPIAVGVDRLFFDSPWANMGSTVVLGAQLVFGMLAGLNLAANRNPVFLKLVNALTSLFLGILLLGLIFG